MDEATRILKEDVDPPGFAVDVFEGKDPLSLRPVPWPTT